MTLTVDDAWADLGMVHVKGSLELDGEEELLVVFNVDSVRRILYKQDLVILSYAGDEETTVLQSRFVYDDASATWERVTDCVELFRAAFATARMTKRSSR